MIAKNLLESFLDEYHILAILYHLTNLKKSENCHTNHGFHTSTGCRVSLEQPVWGVGVALDRDASKTARDESQSKKTKKLLFLLEAYREAQFRLVSRLVNSSRGDTGSNGTGMIEESNWATKLLGGKYYNETSAIHSQPNHHSSTQPPKWTQ
jgi:hypothetical protein